MEDFQLILREIIEGGGEASICRSAFVDGLTDAEIEQLFHQARSRDYEDIIAEARSTLKAFPAGRRVQTERGAEAEQALAKLSKRFAAVAKIDFFETTDRRSAGEALKEIEDRLRSPTVQPAAPTPPVDREQFRGRTWVTRQGVF